jgi:hypothetical protein
MYKTNMNTEEGLKWNTQREKSYKISQKELLCANLMLYTPCTILQYVYKPVLPTTTQQPDILAYTKCDVQLIKDCS